MKFFKKFKNIGDSQTSPTLSFNSVNSIIFKAIENLPDGVQILDFEYNFVYVNEALVRQSQTTKDKLLNHKLTEVFVGVENTRTFEIVKEAMEKRLVINEDIEFKYPNGEKKWYELRLEPIDIGLVVFSIDITERKRKEKVLEQSNQELEIINKTEKKFSGAMTKLLKDLAKTKNDIELEKARDDALLSSIGEGIFAVDVNNRFIFINKKAEEILGIKSVDLIGKKKTPSNIPLEYLDGKFVPSSKRPTAIALKTRRSSYNEKYLLGRPDGMKIPISLTVTPVKMDGKVIGAIDVFRDISEEMRIDKSKTEFVSVASHQLRTPLGIIKWYVEMLQKEDYIKKAPPKVSQYISEIERGNTRLLALVKDLLSVSRIDQDKVQNNPQLINLSKFIPSIVENMKMLSDSRNVDIQVDIDKLTPKIKVDPAKLHSVIENLVSNSIKYSKDEGGFVKISSRKYREGVVIEVEDDGIGIAEEDIKDLFQKFFRAVNAIASNPDGSGLGLYVAKSYVDSWGGEIDVRSKLNEGTKFKIYIPII